jgi:hypothetical protein
MKISMDEDGDPLDAIEQWQGIAKNLETHRQAALQAKNTRLRRTLKEIDRSSDRDKNLAEMLGAVKEASEKHQAEYNESTEEAVHAHAHTVAPVASAISEQQFEPVEQFSKAHDEVGGGEQEAQQQEMQEMQEMQKEMQQEVDLEIDLDQFEEQMPEEQTTEQDNDALANALVSKKKQQVVEMAAAKSKKKKKKGKTGLEMAMSDSGGGSADGGSCGEYRVDMLAATMGVCKCGHPKSAHSTAAINAIQKKDLSKIVV